MPIATVEKDINGTTYSVTTLPGSKGFEMALKLPKFVGGAFGALIGANPGQSDGDALEIDDPEMLVKAFAELGQHLASAEFWAIVWQLLDGVRANDKTLVDGTKRAHFDQHFAGNYADLIPLVIFAAKVNFESFFAGNNALAELLARAAGAGKTRLSRLQGSRGKSPGSSPGGQQASENVRPITTSSISS